MTQSSQGVRKHLNTLKKLSQNLRQSIQHNPQPDIQQIQKIINMTKNIHKPNNHHPNLYHSTSAINSRNQSEFDQPIYSNPPINKKQTEPVSSSMMFKHLTKTQSLNYINSDNNICDSQQQFSEYQNPTLRRQFSNSKKLKPEDQHINLYFLKQMLENQLKQIKEKLKLHEEKYYGKSAIEDQDSCSDNQQQETNNKKPYFKRKQNILLFVTRLTVTRQQYHKVQYTEHFVHLTLDRLIIHKRPPTSKLNQSQTLQNPKTSTIRWQLNLLNLSQVQYLDNNKMLLIFQSDKKNQKLRLFLQFSDIETMHFWDLGLFINFKIVTNLNSHQIFMEEEQEEKQQDNHGNQYMPSEASPNQQNNNRQSFTSNYQSNLKQKQYKYPKTARVRNKYLLRHPQNDSNHEIIEQKNQQQEEQIKQPERQTESQPQEELQQDKDQSMQQHKNEGQNNSAPNHQLKNQQTQTIISNYQDQQSKIKMDDEQQSRRLQQARLTKIKEDHWHQLEQKKKVQNAIKQLQKGIFMTKYSRAAFSPHQKRVFISVDNKNLCWQDKDSFDFKYIPITDIESIDRGEIGPGVQKHLGKKIKDPNCFIVINTSQNKIIEFGVKSPKIMDKFVNSIELFLDENRAKKEQKEQKQQSFDD